MRVREVMTKQVRTAAQDQEIEPQGLLAEVTRFRHLPVIGERGHLVGMLSRLDLLQAIARWGWRKSVRIGDLTSGPAVTIAHDASLEDATERMRRAHVHALPVLGRGGSLVGIVTDTDLLAGMAGARAAPQGFEEMPIERLMTWPVVTVEESSALSDAADALVQGAFRHVPVVDASGRLVGMLSERDLRARFGTDLKNFTRATYEAQTELVSDVMTPDPLSIPATARLADALAIFANDRVGALPVVDANDKVVGIVSYVDLLACLREQRRAWSRRSGVPARRGGAAPRATRRSVPSRRPSAVARGTSPSRDR